MIHPIVVSHHRISQKGQQPSFDVKKDALIRLGILVYGTFGTPQINPDTKNPGKPQASPSTPMYRKLLYSVGRNMPKNHGAASQLSR